jgi:hypothetical protein
VLGALCASACFLWFDPWQTEEEAHKPPFTKQLVMPYKDTVFDVRTPHTPNIYTFQRLLDAIQTVEVGNYGGSIGLGIEGDEGEALGPFQIHWGYHEDAMGMNSWLLDHELCLDSYDYSVVTMYSYMIKYAGEEAITGMCTDKLTLGNCETIARIHNGGPSGPEKNNTLVYWNKVKNQLQQQGR